MAGLTEKLASIQKFLDILTWTKIAQLVVFLLIVALAWATYESRNSIYNYITRSKISNNSHPVKLSRSSTEEIIKSVGKSQLIVGIQVFVVDFQRNAREVIFTTSDVPELKLIYENFEKSNIFEFPLFNADIANNKRLVSLINGEFACNPFKETIGYKILPEASKHIEYVCAVGIPPFYGKFSGIVSIYLNRQPTVEEVDQIRNLSKNISSLIYEKDFR
jgi:hypothetical protein